MSTNLYWNPVIPKNRTHLDDRLKWILQKKYGSPISIRVDYTNVEYFQGLADAGVDGASDVIEAVESYDVIEIEESC